MDTETGNERHILEAHLDEDRATVVRKCTGLSWEDATRRLGPTATSVAGILKHLIDVERWWFRHHLAGEAGVPFSWSEDEEDLEFEMSDTDTLEGLVAEYVLACGESRAVAAAHDLDDQMVRPVRWLDGARPSLRWVYVHMLEETARHNGHLDIYRELIDGQTDRD